MNYKQKRFSTLSHGTVTFSLGKSFSSKPKAISYANRMKEKGYYVRTFKEGNDYNIYTKRK